MCMYVCVWYDINVRKCIFVCACEMVGGESGNARWDPGLDPRTETRTTVEEPVNPEQGWNSTNNYVPGTVRFLGMTSVLQ